MARVIFWACAGVLFYTYAGYYLLLRVLVACLPRRRETSAGTPEGGSEPSAPTVAVVVAAYNEERVIGRRIENLLALEYPRDRLRVVVASDGSTDGTLEVARRYAAHGVLALGLPRRGKALAQNDAVAQCREDVVVFTDADSEFDRNFLRAIVRPFLRDGRVGCVVGNLGWRGAETPTGRFQRLYWALETDLRRLESELGILAGATGAGMAVRRDLWRPMSDPIDDSDVGTPLDVILQNRRVVFAEDALVYDVPFSSAGSEFRAKVRATSKSFVIILRRWGVRERLRYPFLTWRLVSHYFLRWLAPFVGVGLIASTAILARQGGVYLAAAVLEGAVLALGFVGYVGERRGRRVPLASVVFNFLAIHVGMALGVLIALAHAAKGPWEPE